jgi:hypothetical protein
MTQSKDGWKRRINVNNFNFVSKVKDVTIYSSDKNEYTGSDFEVRWSVEIEVRDWGIKSIIPIINRIQGTATVTGPDGSELAEIEIDSNDGWEINSDLVIENGQMAASFVEINMETKRMEVS